MRLLKLHHALLVAVWGTGLAVSAFLGHSLYQHRIQIKAEVARETLVPARLLAEHVEHVLRNHNHRLGELADDQREQRHIPAQQFLDQHHALLSDGLRLIRTVDSSGRVLASSLADDPRHGVAAEPWFAELRRGRMTSVLHPEPVFDPAAERWGLVLARSRFDEKGHFAGAMVGFFDPEVGLSGFLNAMVANSTDIVGLWSSQRQILARSPRVALEDGKLRVTPYPGDLPLPGEDSGAELAGSRGGGPRFLALKTLNIGGLVAAYTRGKTEYMAPWREHANVVGLAIAGILGGNLVITWLLWRARHRDARTTAVLERAAVAVYRFSTVDGGLDYSDGVINLLGWSAEHLRRNPLLWRDSIHAEDAQRIGETLGSLAPGELFSLEYRIRHADGGWRWLLDRAVTIEHQGGALLIDGIAADITARKEAELALAAREADWNLLLDHLPLMIFVKEAESGRYVRSNLYHERLTGVPMAALTGKTDADFWPEQAESFRAKDAEVVAKGGVLDIPAEAIDTPLGQRWLHTRKVCISGADGRPRFLLGMSLDITEERQLRERVDAERTLMRSILDAIPDIVFLKDRHLIYREVNRAGADYLGRAKMDILGATEQELFPPDAVGSASASDRQLLAELQTQTRIEHLRRPDGAEVIFEITKRPLFDATGAVIGLVGVAHDITAREQAERERGKLVEELASARIAQARIEVALAEDRSRQLIRAIGEAVIGLAVDGTITFFNPAAERLFGYSEEYALGRSLHALTHHTRADGSPCAAAECPIAQGLGHPGAHPSSTDLFWCGDGRSFTGEYSFLPLMQESRIVGAVLVMRDVTERERAAQRLRMLSRTVEEGPAAVSMADANGIIQYVNSRFTEITGYPEAEVLGRTHKLIASGLTSPEVYREMWAALDAGREWSGDLLNRHRDGHTYWAHSLITPLRDDDGRVTHLIAISADISATRELEEKATLARETAERALHDLARQEQRLRLMTDNVPALINYVDGDLRELYCNLPFAQFFDFDRDQSLGRPLREVIGARVFDRVEPYFRRALAGESLRYETTRGERILAVAMTPARDSDMAVNGVHVLAIDITEQKQAARALEEARQAAEAANVAKGQFLANISHEIRTPMNAILGLSELLLRTRLDSRQRDYLEKSHRSAKLLLGLLNDVLDYSKIEAGRLELDPQPFRLGAVLDQIADLYGDAAAQKGLEFIIDAASDLPDVIVGDSLRLTQVISNLCSNAVKFTPSGAVSLRVETEPALQTPQAPMRLRVTVIDSGIGMSAEQTPRVFDAFAQADGSTTRRFGGTGLGLSICRNLVELMGGTLEVESRPGQGSSFSFAVPLELAAPGAIASLAAAESAAPGGSELSGARILVVDDHPLNVEIITAFLREADCEVGVAVDGREALECLRQADFDAVLMDCQMPVMDGYEATRAIRREPRWRDLPVIAMTANVMQGDREKCFAAGMNDFVPKPVMIDQLLAVVARHLRSAARFVPVPVPAPPLPAAAPAPAAPAASGGLDLARLVAIDAQAALRLTLGKVEFLERVLRIFHTTQHDFLARFAAAAGTRHDPDAAGRAAHTLKGSAASIGAHALRDAAMALEQACKQQLPAAEVQAALDRVERELAPVIACIADALGLADEAASPAAKVGAASSGRFRPDGLPADGTAQ